MSHLIQFRVKNGFLWINDNSLKKKNYYNGCEKRRKKMTFLSHFHKDLKRVEDTCTEVVYLTPLTCLFYISSGQVILHHIFYLLYKFSYNSGSYLKMNRVLREKYRRGEQRITNFSFLCPYFFFKNVWISVF